MSRARQRGIGVEIGPGPTGGAGPFLPILFAAPKAHSGPIMMMSLAYATAECACITGICLDSHPRRFRPAARADDSGRAQIGWAAHREGVVAGSTPAGELGRVPLRVA